MTRNVGGVDRMLRIFFGSILIAIALFSDHPYANWGWIGIIPVLTGLVRWCPAYLPFGLSSYRDNSV